jgi:Integrase core domain.
MAVFGGGDRPVFAGSYQLVDVTVLLACDVLQMALWRRKRPEDVIVHTDRGGQYCSTDYQALLKRHNLWGSMSAKDCCYDNACAESVFHSLKVECIYGGTLHQWGNNADDGI